MKVLSKQINNADFWKGFYIFFAFLGMILMYLETFISETTINKFIYELLIIVSTGLVVFFFNKEHYKKIYNLKSNIFPFLQSILSWGFISCYLYMAVNYYLADKTKTIYTIKIESKSSIKGSGASSERQPVIYFNYQDLKKRLVFRPLDSELVDRSDSVKVQIQKGALGFDIICNYKLIEKSKQPLTLGPP